MRDMTALRLLSPLSHALKPQPLLNSYSGVYLSIGYHICAKIERGMMRNDLSKKIEFMGEIRDVVPALLALSLLLSICCSAAFVPFREL